MLDQLDWPGNIDMMWEDPEGELWFRELAVVRRG